MKNNPKISVITAVYNGETHLAQCLESIHSQTFADFEHIIVNDGSTDNTAKILEKWQKKDDRIRVLHSAQNQGRATARNRAITAARSPLIAVLDADDYSLPDRLERQYAYLEQHPEAQLLGGDMLIHGDDRRWHHPENNEDIRAKLFFDSSLFHSTVMMRKSMLAKAKAWYDPALPLAQDYGLWAALLPHKEVVFANLPEPLTYYRLSENPRPGYNQKQFDYANEVRGRIMTQLGLEKSQENLLCHLALLFGNAGALHVTPAQCAQYGNKLLAANAKRNLTSQKALENKISISLAAIFGRDISAKKL